MNFRIFLEWDEQCGILLSKTYPLIDGIQNPLKDKDYGTSISRIGIVMSCMNRYFKQRKRFKKDTKEFTYDILLDYFLIRHSEMAEKKAIIRRQMVEITEQTFSKYKFEDFDKAGFLTDFKEIVNSVAW
jgi:hypothetical protein